MANAQGKIIAPKILKGFRDLLPESMIPKKKIIRTLEQVFESFGFSPIDTPALEYTEILLGKGSGETDKQIYRFEDHGGRDVALRFDLTVPLARFVSQHFSELVFPFKRYHIAPVWRGENTQKGRYREFYQCDFDILGSDNINADFEILQVIRSGFEAIGCESYIININHRKLLNAILAKFGEESRSQKILQTIDKIYKVGRDEVVRILVEDEGMSPENVNGILTTLRLNENFSKEGIKGEEIFTVLEKLRDELEDKAAAEELLTVFHNLEECGVLEHFAYNPAITRGLDYYTGIVFESFITDRMEFGSVCSGGRYDNLTGLYSKNVVSGVGASFGLDRLLSVLEDKQMFTKKNSVADVMIFNLDDSLIAKYYLLAEKMQKAGINCEVVSSKSKLGNQFKLAERRQIRYALIAGTDEFENGKFNLKDVFAGEEKKAITLEEIISEIQANKKVNG